MPLALHRQIISPVERGAPAETHIGEQRLDPALDQPQPGNYLRVANLQRALRSESEGMGRMTTASSATSRPDRGRQPRRLHVLVEKTPGSDLLREIISFGAEWPMELKVSGLTGAALERRAPGGWCSATAFASGIGRRGPAASHCPAKHQASMIRTSSALIRPP